ncbi:hypothetical protein ACFFGH_07455 [Lysobacter korlensis]|uniref:STAS/SEC14 domain-containing protein n=1 Tax=Lysobacter korlensis TaxID=553636 RepID=A0ABV6RL20_9GAMM
MSYRVEFSYDAGILRAHLSGGGRDLDSTIDAWRRIAAEIHERRPPAVLVVSDVPGEPFTPAQVQAFIQAMIGLGFESLRIAYVYSQAVRWHEGEVAEILAAEAGFEARAFAEERAARMWLRHGERAADV